jgi:hypothetical protein
MDVVVAIAVDERSVAGGQCGEDDGWDHADDTEVDRIKACSILSTLSRRASTDCTNESKSAGRSERPACIF